jgi:Leucine-rich repeat (LRR) protein
MILLSIQSQILINAINIDDGCWKHYTSSLSRISRCAMKTIQDNSFTNLPSDLTTLNLASTKVKTIKIEAFTGLDDLEKLDLSNNELTGLPEKVFNPLRNTKVIKLQSNQLQNFSFDVFANNQNLEHVDLASNKMKTLVPIQHKDGFSIKTLKLNNNDLENISEICELHNLESLDLSGNPNLDFETFKSGCWPELKQLHLMNTNLKRLNNDYHLLFGLNKLQLLNLATNNLEILCVGSFPALLEMETLNVYNNKLKTVNPQELKQKFKKLTQFVMNGNTWDCHNLENSTKSFDEMKIKINFYRFLTCSNSTTANVSATNTCQIFDNDNNESKFSKYAWQMIFFIIILFFVFYISLYFCVLP